MSEAATNPPGKRALFNAFWQLTKPYWTSDQKWKAIGLLVLVVSLNLCLVYLSVQFNNWSRDFYNALAKLDEPAFWAQIKRFGILVGPWILVQVYALYCRQMLEINWRQWLTERFKDRWLLNQNYYRLQLTDRGTDNPDQRIADDIGQFVSYSLRLSIDLLNSLVSLATFVTILWTLSGALEFALGSYRVSIPGYMVWAALIYIIVGTGITILIGKRLVGLNFEQQKREADYRFALIRVRENAESIAFYKGEGPESVRLTERLGWVVQNFWAIMGLSKYLTGFTFGWKQLAVIFPFLMAGHRLFTKQIQLGDLMQISSAFREVYDSLSYVMESFSLLATWKAVIDRLSTFEDGLRHAAALPVPVAAQAESGLVLNALTVKKPDGTVLLDNLSLTLHSGDRLLVRGASGAGKSTLLRALATIWPYADGEIAYQKNAGVLFLSQKPYLPLGSLRDALSYPATPLTDDALLAEMLDQLGLSHLRSQLDLVRPWSHELSLGEQQRIAIGRALLRKPALLVLDEATSAIDEAAELALYQAILAQLPDSIVISVGHRSSLKQFHNRFLDCHGEGHWALA